MSTRSKKQTQQKSGSNVLTYIVVILIVSAIGVYWYLTKDDMAETYKIKSTNSDEFFHEKSYINLTGRGAEEKKIKLSEDYWTSGKFDVK